MLPRKYRFSLKNQRKKGRSLKKGYYQGPLFNFVVYSQFEGTQQPSVSRFTFVVSSRTVKKAVERNLTKRLLSEAVFQLLAQIKPGFDIVIFGKQGVAEGPPGETRLELEKALKKTSLVKIK